MEKEGIEIKLKEFDDEINKKEIQIRNSQEYKSLETAKNILWDKRNENHKEFRFIKKKIILKYIDNLNSRYWGFSFNSNNVKSSVKQGIKKGLGITNVSFINEFDLKKIVEQLIERDLKKIEKVTDMYKTKLNGIDKQIKEYNIKEHKLINDNLKSLIKQRGEINYQLNQNEIKKNMKIDKKKKEVKKLIKTSLPKLMKNIIKEVNKGLILDGLK